MSNIKDTVDAVKYRYSNHKYQTDNFRWDYTSATDEDVRNTSSVFEDTILVLSLIVDKAILPKYRVKMREDIAYLIGLRHRQSEAWERFIQECEQKTINIENWLQQHGNR